MPDTQSRADLRRTRIGLLRQVRDLLLATRDVFRESEVSTRCLRVARGRASVSISIIATRLDTAGFARIDRIYRIREELGEGRSVSGAELVWLDNEIDNELQAQ